MSISRDEGHVGQVELSYLLRLGCDLIARPQLEVLTDDTPVLFPGVPPRMERMGARGVRPALGWHLAWGFCVGFKEASEGMAVKRQDGDVRLSKNSDCYTEILRS